MIFLLERISKNIMRKKLEDKNIHKIKKPLISGFFCCLKSRKFLGLALKRPASLLIFIVFMI